MKTKVMILANLLQKIALWKTGFNKGIPLSEHIRMLDWIMSDNQTRDIEEIINDPKYKLSPKEYIEKYEK